VNSEAAGQLLIFVMKTRMLTQVCTNFPKPWECPQNFRRQKGRDEAGCVLRTYKY
jgi:hypothetical protein